MNVTKPPSLFRRFNWVVFSLLLTSLTSNPVGAQPNGTITHTAWGLQYTGVITKEQYFLGPGSLNDINLVGILDGPRRIIFPEKDNLLQAEVGSTPVTFELSQEVVGHGVANISAIGSTLQALPFNQYGRRRVFVDTNRGPQWLLQGITFLDPTYVRVQGIELAEPGLSQFPFDFRMATSAISGDLLVQLLRNATDDLGDYRQRERIVEFLISAQRYNEAIRELNQLQVDFAELDRQRFELLKTRLVTASARLVLQELDRRSEAGQILTVTNLLENIDPQNVSAETLVDVRTRLRSIQESDQELEQLKGVIRKTFENYRRDREIEANLDGELTALETEMVTDLNRFNRDRLSTFLLRANDAANNPEMALSFLISGWILGAADAFDNVFIALTLPETRALLVRYLRSTEDAQRAEILQRLQELESGNPRYLAAMARHILPWMEPPTPEPNSQGFFRMKLTHLSGQPEVLVQLPPEYNPYKKYPCVVALCDIQSNPNFEIEWWDGTLSPADGYRTGQASRNGYIVIAPDWRQPLDFEYSYDPYAAMVALSSLRTCARMFSIDSDRVFLAGHAIGGEVAWDIGLAHPDLWAGVIPISALADRYINFSYKNSAKHLPFYFVVGEFHNPPSRGMVGKIDKREEVFQRMSLSINYRFLVAKYIGRRSEHFLEEITSIFNWTRGRRRSFDVRDFNVRTLRPWDNFFWWFEMHDMPENLTVPPQAWNIKTERRGVEVEASIVNSLAGASTVSVSGGGKSATFWFSPRWVNMDQEINVRWNRVQNTKLLMQPSRTVILEDLRTRSDTQNPFWASLTYDNMWFSSNDLP